MASQSGGYVYGGVERGGDREGGGGGGGGGKRKPNFSSMKQPSLIDQLKGILSEYPDGGQIIKELLQNAEDAGASTVQIMYDARDVNQDSLHDDKYTKFFKGPALLLYNDSVFTDHDWEGIKMVSNSVKKDDRLKVGRFGLGFKSVLHITDFPSVISGNKLLLINPHERFDEVNAEFEVDHLAEYEGMDASGFLSAYGGLFQVKREDLTNGSFRGTVFRFPLRQIESDLSDTIYTEQKVFNLFEAFKKESAFILLFLKGIANVTINIRKGEEHFEDVATVELTDNVEEVLNERKRFREVISGLGPDYDGEPAESFTQVTTETTLFSQNRLIHQSTGTWLVVNYFMGDNVSDEFRKLIKDKSIGYCPYVGVAVPLRQDTEERLDGHTFCFLPLPIEGRKQTGLPFHVNGFFALNQSRHHIKWPTEEQKDSQITDKDILWNQCMVKEAVPLAYNVLIENAVRIARSRQIGQEVVTQMLPLYDATVKNWQPSLKLIYDKIRKLAFLKVHDSNSWVTVFQAFYVTGKDWNEEEVAMKDQIVNALLELNQPYVNISVNIFETFCHFYDGIVDLDPKILANILNADGESRYKLLQRETKLCLLKLIMSTSNYHLLDGLELIPLQSGNWNTFMPHLKGSEHLLLSSETYEQLTFPGLEDNFIEIPISLLPHFNELCTTGMYNIKHQTDDDTIELLERLLSSVDKRLKQGSVLTLNWLEKVWRHFRFCVDKICHLALVPVMRKGSWEKPIQVDLIKIDNMAILKTSEGHEPLPEGLCHCLEQLSVTVLPSCPDWFPVRETSAYISQPSHYSVVTILVRLINSTPNIQILADRFNRDAAPVHREDFCTFMTNCQMSNTNLRVFLQKLNIFHETGGDNIGDHLVSLDSSSHQKEYIKDIIYPIRYPKLYLVVEHNNEQLLRTLGALKCHQSHMVALTLENIMSSDYTENERIKFMEFFIENFHKFELTCNVINYARQVKFIRCGPILKVPSELYDPTDTVLRNILTDDMFPKATSKESLHILKKLGLRSLPDMSADHIRDVALALDKAAKRCTESAGKRCTKSAQRERKASAILEILSKEPKILEQNCSNGNALKNELRHLQWVQVVRKPPVTFPSCIPWYTHSQSLCRPADVVNYGLWHTVVGSTMPCVECDSDAVSGHFGWDEDPPLAKVVKQLRVMSKHYNMKLNVDILLMIKTIYQFLNNHRQQAKYVLSTEELLWCGHKFVSPKNIIMHRIHGNIDLEPYFFFMPVEFAVDLSELYIELGCCERQDVDVLILCLHKIRDKYKCVTGSIDQDMSLIVSILQKLQEVTGEDRSNNMSKLLIPVKTTSKDVIVFKPPSECTYLDNDDLYDDGLDAEYSFVHERISESMAQALGIKTFKRHILDTAEGFGFEEWGLEEPLTTRLSSLLREGYKDGLSVLKELVQNADDACAKTVQILYDERQNGENTTTRLLNKRMSECQGPALWFYNDATFTEEDFANIIKLNGATKKNDPGKIGKFGQGFCSVYNLTDVPCFYSGRTFVFFDPHKTYLGDALPGMSSGMKINLNHRRDALLSQYRDQFQPFEDVFHCSLFDKDMPFDGTLFRFPLRTEHQASISKIKGMAYSKEEVIKLLSMFIEAAGDMLLFTQNIEQVEIYYLGPHGKPSTDSVCIFSLDKQEEVVDQDGQHRQRVEGILKTVESSNLSAMSEVHIINMNVNILKAATCIIEDAKEIKTKCTWVISWSSGDHEAKSLANKSTKWRALPIASVAVPCTGPDNFQPCPLNQTPNGYHKYGRLFCFLPLPLECGLNFHINAYFDVTSDRRQLLSDSEDDKQTPSHQWNKALLTDATVCAFLKLLETVANVSSLNEYYQLWPTSKPKHTKDFVQAFYKKIIASDTPVFKGEGHSGNCFGDVVFIDPEIREDENIGHLCLGMLKRFPPRFGKQVVDMPTSVFRVFRESNDDDNNKSNIVQVSTICSEEFILKFLHSLQHSFWQENMHMRNAFIAFSLKSDSVKVIEELKLIECIPTKPNGRLRKPSDVLKEGFMSVESLFSVEDERFVIKNLMFSDEIINKVEGLGMITEMLPTHLLLERCSYVAQKGQSCCSCAYDLSLKILQYLCIPDVAKDLQDNEKAYLAMCNEFILPVLNRPHHWKLPWYSERNENTKTFSSICELSHHTLSSRRTLSLGQPRNMHRQEVTNRVSCIGLVVDEVNYNPRYGEIDALKYLGVYLNVSFQTAVSQLQIVTSNYTYICEETENTFKSCMEELYSAIWSAFINSKALEQDEMMVKLNSFSDSPVILFGRALIKPCDVAFKLKNECHPYLYRLPESYSSQHPLLFKALGVKEYFACEDVINAIEHENDKWLGQPCDNVDTILNLLHSLTDSMTRDNVKYEQLTKKDLIVAPDQNGILRPTSDLIVDDEGFSTTQNVHRINDTVSKGLAEKIGVQSKQRKCRGNISKGIPFGQKEELVPRLKGLLKAYPCDSGIMKELIQNADDAGASEICFITDFSTHEEDQTYRCKMINHPSLCVYNNSCFTEQDLQGIHDLGSGSKAEDSTKTGQHGVGFNAVYHLTDIPCFMTVGPDLSNGGTLCIFDPLCEHIEGVKKDEPGIRSEIDGLKYDFPKVLLGFHEDKLLTNKMGTVFRFPLRQKKSCISNEVFTPERVNKMFEELKADMFEALLFLKNVSCIKIMDISSGEVEEQYVVCLKMSTEDRMLLHSFHSMIKECAARNKDNKLKNLQIAPLEVQYEAKVEDSNDCSKDWLIVQRFGSDERFNNGEHKELVNAFNDALIGLLPIGGIAIPIDRFKSVSKWQTSISHTEGTQTENSALYERSSRCSSSETCRAFCVLPLPVETGLPVHVNGHFALDHEARRDLWHGGYRETWNCFILNYVVTPAWIRGVARLQKLFVEPRLAQVSCWTNVNRLMNLYHHFFPRKMSSGTYWAKCVKYFYNTVMNGETILFPVVEKSYVQNVSFNISWYPLSSQTGQYEGVFNGIHLPTICTSHEAIKKNRKMENLISDVLKNLGMKLLSTPTDIRNTIESLKFKTEVSNTGYIIDFLRTFDEKDGCCIIGGINIPLCETNYKTYEHLRHVLILLKLDENFRRKVAGLPVMLTADGILKQCSVDGLIISSEYSDLLPQSSHVFVHTKLLSMFPLPSRCKQSETEETVNETEEMVNVVVNLTVDKFIELLPMSCDRSIYCTGKSVPWKQNSLVTPSWIKRLFHFLYTQNRDNLQETLENIEDWSFLPSLEVCNEQRSIIQSRSLIPISQFYTLFKSIEREGDVNQVLKNLLLPSLDVAVLTDLKQTKRDKRIKKITEDEKITDAFSACCTTTDSPVMLLKCLLHHKDKLRSDAFTTNSATFLLSYFERNLDVLIRKYGSALKKDIQKLPLFITIQQTIVSIGRTDRVHVLPKQIPSQGISEWAKKEGVVLLKQSEWFEKLFEYLGLTLKHPDTFYADILLPSLTRSMPEKDWKAHVLFIRNISFTSSDKKQTVMELLEVIPFIMSRRANEHYNHENPVFKCMLPTSSFLPEEYRTIELIRFLEEIGLVMEVDEDLFVQFATLIENQSTNIDNDVITKSNVLVNCLVNWPNISHQLLERIKNIAFVIPFKVEASFKRYCKQYENASRLISLSSSTSERHWRLCWSSMCLIPNRIYNKLGSDILERLGICSDPPLSRVISHCKQMCISFKSCLKEDMSGECTAFVEEQMLIFYQHLFNENKHNSFQSLSQTHFVYIPNARDLVLPKRIVFDMRDDHEEQIIPYFYRAPKKYISYFTLFRQLGSLKHITCKKLAEILEEVWLKHKNKTVIGSDIGVVTKTIAMLFHCLESYYEERELHSVERLYLPNRNMILCPSTELYVNNLPTFKNRLQGKVKLNWLMNLRDLQIKSPNPSVILDLLPDKIKPLFLRKEVTENICLEYVTKIESSQVADRLTCFLRSEKLLEGLVRLVSHESQEKGIPFGKNEVENISMKLAQIQCMHVKGLQTTLKLDGTVIKGTEEKKRCHISRDAKNTIFYFQWGGRSDHCLSEIVDEEDGLFDLVIACVEKMASERLVSLVLHCIKEPRRIGPCLDKRKIPEYNVCSVEQLGQAFPSPGTYVEDQMLPFLVRNFEPFLEHEYKHAVMAVKETALDGAVTSKFKHVHIIEPIEDNSALSVQYVVDCGEERRPFPKVQMWYLFRLVRESDNEELEFGNEPKNETDFQICCQQVRNLLIKAWSFEELQRNEIIQRLLHHWCDGLCKENEYARRVYNYIHEITIQLEHGQDTKEDINGETGKIAPEACDSVAYRISQSVREESRLHMEKLKSSTLEYRSDRNKGTEGPRRSDIEEAKRWLKQATNDYRAACAAVDVMTDVQGHNWTCYKCYRASEKALKAVLYSINADKVQNNVASHDLTQLASHLSADMQEQARLLMIQLGDQSQLQYPHSVFRDRIPSEIYDKEAAVYAIEHTKRILDLANEAIL